MAAWYFGANASGQPAYDPATGRSVDGIEGNGNVNRNGGAESTIHGLLSMLALDANPDVAELARTATVRERVGNRTVQVEGATLAGGAHVVKPPGGGWTGESYYEGNAYAALPAGGSARVTVGKGDKRLVLAGRGPAARQHRGHDVPRRGHRARHGPLRRHRRPRATHRLRARCCR